MHGAGSHQLVHPVLIGKKALQEFIALRFLCQPVKGATATDADELMASELEDVFFILKHLIDFLRCELAMQFLLQFRKGFADNRVDPGILLQLAGLIWSRTPRCSVSLCAACILVIGS